MALLDDAPRSASVIAQEKSELAILSRQRLLRSPEVELRPHARASSGRSPRGCRRANATIEGLASLDVKARLARYFRELAGTRGRKAGGGWSVVVRPSQREIADTIGSSRETVSRTMSQMAVEQLIVPKGKAVYVRLEGGDAGAGAARLRRGPWSSAPGPCRTS